MFKQRAAVLTRLRSSRRAKQPDARVSVDSGEAFAINAWSLVLTGSRFSLPARVRNRWRSLAPEDTWECPAVPQCVYEPPRVRSAQAETAQARGLQRGNSEAPRAREGEACVNRGRELFDQPGKVAPHWTPNENGCLSGRRESRV